MPIVTGLDLSLTHTGVTRIAQGDALGHEVRVRSVLSKPPARRKGDPPPSVAVRSARLRRLAGEIVTLCAGSDLVCVEGPSYASQGAGTWDRAGLWWLVVGRLTGAGLNVVEIPPSNVKTYATGKGNADKDAVLAAVVRRYTHVEITGNDEADSVVLAAMGARFAGFPIEASLPQTHLRSVETVRWV